jgi:hypothetical protein
VILPEAVVSEGRLPGRLAKPTAPCMKQPSPDGSALRIGLALSAAAIVGLAAYLWSIFHHGELRDKVAFGDLGALASTHPLQPGEMSLLRDYEGTGLDVLGFGSDGAPGVHWIVLNEVSSDDEVFGADNQVIPVTCDQIDRVLRPVRVHDAVTKYLHKWCRGAR